MPPDPPSRCALRAHSTDHTLSPCAPPFPQSWIRPCYRSYAESRQEQINVSDALPAVVRENPAALDYFKWVQRIQSMLAKWKSRLQDEEASYEDIYWYFRNQQKFHDLANAIAATSIMISKAKVELLKDRFLHFYKMLNSVILKYIPGDPKAGWCSVTSILTEYGVGFPQDLHAELSVNVIFPDEAGKATTKELISIPPPLDKKFTPPTSIYLLISKYVSLKSLRMLFEQITLFLAPVLPHMKLLVYFKLKPSYLFTTHMHRELSKVPQNATNGITLEHVGVAVDHTQALLIKVLEGTATYGDIIAEDQLKLGKLNVEEEFSNLLECQSLHKYGGAGLTGLKSLLKLIQFAEPILMLEQVFKQYGLDSCLSDPDFKEIRALALTLQDSKERAKITFQDAKLQWKIVYRALCLKEDASPTCLELFSKIADSADFYHFLKEKELTGTLGYDRFRYDVEIITQHQELDEYQETVLNHLFSAFTFISPFMNAGHKSLHSLMSAVTALNLSEGLSQLETVRKNMHLIQYWFSSSENTPENVSSELKGILESGSYYIETTTAVSGKSRLQLMLKYDLSFVSASHKASSDQPTSEDQQQAKAQYQSMTLTTEQIDDFIHRLELLKGEDQSVRNFLHLNEIAHKLLEVFEKLQDLGHPKVSQKDFAHTFQCSALLPVVMKEVSATDTVLKPWMEEVEKWMNEVENLLTSNKWLLFFRVPKLMVLYEALTAEKSSVPTIIHEIGFLFKRNVHTSEIFKNAVKIAVETSKQNAHSERSPLKTVGSFLDHQYLFDQAEVKKWMLPIRYDKKYACFPQANSVLYNATGYTQCELVGLILGVYGGPPEAFEFLHCRPTTTEQELRLLMKRAIQHPRLYLIAEVNNLPYQLQEILLQLFLQLKHQQTQVYFIETGPSLLREVLHLDYKEEKLPVDENTAQIIYEKVGLLTSEDWSGIELVHSKPGNGKTHYIRDKMKNVPESHQVTIVISEAFTTVSAIKRLRTLPRDARNCAIFFNFTILPPTDSTDVTVKEHYQQLIQDIRWFFFDLLILCYVEDPATGLSFHFPAGLSWALYAEVPSRATCGSPVDFLESFKEEIPALALLGTPVYIGQNRDYCIDDDVQLVCKYLRVYESEEIDKTYNARGNAIKFSTDPELSDVECKRLLKKYMPRHVRKTKITQKLFIQYMKRRCTFLDNLPAFNYNPGYGEYVGKKQRTDTHHLGSTLMQTMLREVSDFCDPSTKEGWSQKAHQQLIYDFCDGGGSFGLISLLPDDHSPQADKDRLMFTKIGVEIPSLDDLHSRTVLDKYLSRALGVPLSKDGRLSPIDERQYVLTLDFTLKMLNIHERYECGVPVIIEGETGVGKTALIEMLSELWNHSWIAEWNRDKDHIVDLMRRKMGDLDEDAVDDSQRGACAVALYNYGAGENVTEEMWKTIAQLPDNTSSSGRFYSVLNQSLLKLKGNLKFAMLNLKLSDGERLDDIFSAITETEECSEVTAHLLYILFSATVKSAFHKMNIHANLQVNEIEQFFANIFVQADELQQAYDGPKRPQKLRVPFVTAYLDEINTASCLGLFKEIIIDRTINGKHIPQNVFIIASCNPHRGDVLTVMHEKNHDSWLKGTYYVRKLHPTLEYLKWDYGALNQQQEKEYVNAKMKMLNKQSMSPPDDIVPSLTTLIVESQQTMREYAFEQLMKLDIPATDVKHCASSSVSQRDVQRVFTFYQWLLKTYDRFSPHKETPEMCHRRAVLVSLGLVYYMRLNSIYRSKYKAFLDKHDKLGWEVDFSKAYEDELEWYINMVKLPPNIAKTEALKENVFATIACTMTRTPLIIVGEPGSSKTLSFTVVAANLKGKESIIETFRDTDIFQSLDPHFYQCSRRTTSNEVEKTFKKAINRQHSLARIRLPILCVVFMDEAGLPEEKLESLKVLHYYLDSQEISFVAISNHILDASKTNRAVSLFRPKPTDQDLYELAKVGIVSTDRIPSAIEGTLIDHFCSSYSAVVCHDKFKALFGLRDFIHFVVYLRCKRKYLLTAQLILKALERNFNGSENFRDIYELFFKQIPSSVSVERIHFRSVLDILKDSIADHTTSEGDDVRESTISEDSKTDDITPEGDDAQTSIQSEVCLQILTSMSIERSFTLENTLYILKDNRASHTTSEGSDIHRSIQSVVRYKLIIDPSEDDSLVRLLFTYGVLQRNKTRLYICSDFPGDIQSRIKTVVQIMHSVAVGHTILMCQTDEIHESFYDLFNQRFHSIKDPKHGTRYYTNIALGAHSKLCRVHPKFQCIVVIKKSELEATPPPFLNRFEKYYLTHRSLLENVFSKMPPNLRILLQSAHNKAAEFISCVKQSSLYGCTEETLDSLLLTLLPPTDHEYIPLQNGQNYDESENICVFTLKILLQMLRKNAGFHIPKLLAEEVQEDAICIFKMVLSVPDFKKALEGMTHEKVATVIDEALDVLYHGPEPTEKDTLLSFELHTDALMVIAVLIQWLLSYLCKRLMQLVPPEAIPVHCSGIPTVYIKNYLVFQEHFSLKELIEHQRCQLQGNDWDRSVCPTKLLCFTRSSPLIHQLPADHPATATATVTATNSVENFIRKHIFTDPNSLMICKVSLGHSQDKLEKILFLFANSNHEVLLLIANMQELTQKMVNHLRIMIEEAENKMGSKNKLFVLLLHFPPLMFFNPCYPSLFLQGWSHQYLDTIAYGTLTREGVKSVVDIKRCFYHCYFSDDHSDPKDDEDFMLEALNELLPEAIPLIASRVAFTCESSGATIVLTASQRTELLQNFFNKNTSESGSFGDGEEPRDTVAQILTRKFCKYWTPELMVQQIHQVSRDMYAQDSTLNITDSIQSIVRSAFFDFLVCMFTRLSEEHTINISDNDGSPVVCVDQLFLALLREIRVPELAQLKILSATLRPQQKHKKVRSIFKFPFFKYVCEMLDKVVDESREDVNQRLNIKKPSAHLNLTQKNTKQGIENLYMEVVTARMKKNKLEGCLGVIVRAMDDEDGDTIWRQYFDDFVTYKLELGSAPSDLTRKIIGAYTSPLESMCNDALSRLVSLHVYFHVHHLDLAKITRILSQISKVEKEMAVLSPSAILRPGTFLRHEDINSTSGMPPTLGNIIVTMLFDFISDSDEASSENLQCWYRSYRDIMSVPAMVENILSNLASLPESQLNIMHATYLVMECNCDLSLKIGHQVFKDLSSEQGAECIHFREVVNTALKTMESASPTGIQGKGGYCLQSFMEGLFSFFFSKHRALFVEEDCKYFFEIANKQCTTQAIYNCLSINMLKLYLTKILGEPEHAPSSETAVSKPNRIELFPLNSKYREMVGEVLAAHSDLGSPGPYIPTFYQLKEKMHVEHFFESSKNALMQQPLAHLYFLVVFEHLQNRKYRPDHLVRLTRKIITFFQKDPTPTTETILLSIEKQAIVQMLIYELATYFDPKDPSKLHSLFHTGLDKRLNPLLTDESMGGNSTCISWHALVLAMNLQKQLKNPWELIRLLGDKQSTLVRAFNIMKPLKPLLQPLRRPKCEIHLFPFLNDNSDLARLYKKVCHAMINVSRNETSRKYVEALTKLAKERYGSKQKMKFTTSYGHLLMIDERNAFRMLLWLCVYNEFYVKKLHSSSLADTLSNELRGVLEPEFIELLESFIYPRYMILPPETSLVLEATPGFQGKPLLPGDETDASDNELRHSIANMVAIVLACEPRSNHLWYHMFAADGLSGSYMTGFMYPHKISENLPYDCGVELSRDGMYGRPDYLPHATRGTLSLHSLYLILWANFSAFYMALVTQPDAQEKINGPIILHRQHIHHYCRGQLRNVWLHMGDKLSLSPEEQSFFIMQCMERLLEVNIAKPTLLPTGKLKTLVELDTYERIWHEHIFECSLKDVHNKFAEHCHLHENKLLQNIRCLETHYPHFPTMDEFTHSSVDISSIQNELCLLSMFSLEYRQLEAAGALLPDLMELYNWIHTELAYVVTHENARSDTIEEVINEKFACLEAKSGTDQEENEVENKKYTSIVKLYERVKNGYNSYMTVVGHSIEAGAGTGIRTRGANEIKDSTKFIHFLSAESDDEQWEGSDLLYLLIKDIIKFHNSFLRRVFHAVSSSEHSSLRKYFPEKLEEAVNSTEVNDDVMIIPMKSSKTDEQLQIVRSRYLQPTERTTGACPFDLHRLQIDVIQTYLAGKPLILQSPGDRISFKFKREKGNIFALEGADLNLSVISQGISEEFKLQLEEEYAGELLCEFHSADYQLLAEVVRGLRVATEHLKSLLVENKDELESKKLPELLFLVFKEPRPEILEDIGIKHLSPSQLACLQALKLPYLYSTLGCFVSWVRDGRYDFHQLPFVMKKRLEPEDREALDKLDTNYEGTTSVLLQEMQLFTENLVKSESHLKKTIAENMKKPIMVVVNKAEVGAKISELIPDTVLCQHYVALRIMLRHKMADLQSRVDTMDEDQGKLWMEPFEDLWTSKKFKHLWDIAMPDDYSNQQAEFEYDPDYGLYGYEVEALGKETKEEKPETLPSQSLLLDTSTVTEEQLKQIAEKLTTEDIAVFLKKLKLPEYIELFEENEIDGYLLYDCKPEELEQLGIENAFHCRKITSKFKQHLKAIEGNLVNK